MNTKEQHILRLIKERIRKKNPNAQVMLFGSRARGQATSYSDWDILILLNSPNVTRQKEKEYREELFEIELETGESISTFVFSKSEWESKHSVTPFYQNVNNDGIILT
jgi:uncharacterized protein